MRILLPLLSAVGTAALLTSTAALAQSSISSMSTVPSIARGNSVGGSVITPVTPGFSSAPGSPGVGGVGSPGAGGIGSIGAGPSGIPGTAPPPIIPGPSVTLGSTGFDPLRVDPPTGFGSARLSDPTASREDTRLGGSRSPVAGGAFGSGLGSQPSGGTPLDPGGSFGTPGAAIGR
jgi:hypothetical protein